MKLQSSQDVINLALKITATVDKYYDYSFKIYNERCFIILIELIGQLEDMLATMTDSEKENGLRDVLNQVADAMESKDYVLIRDLLHYELRGQLNVLKN